MSAQFKQDPMSKSINPFLQPRLMTPSSLLLPHAVKDEPHRVEDLRPVAHGDLLGAGPAAVGRGVPVGGAVPAHRARQPHVTRLLRRPTAACGAVAVDKVGVLSGASPPDWSL